jgi:hypothetical protein
MMSSLPLALASRLLLIWRCQASTNAGGPCTASAVCVPHYCHRLSVSRSYSAAMRSVPISRQGCRNPANSRWLRGIAQPRAVVRQKGTAPPIAADNGGPWGKHPRHYTSPPRDRALQVKHQDSSQLPNNGRGSTLLSPSLSVLRGGGSERGRQRRKRWASPVPSLRA